MTNSVQKILVHWNACFLFYCLINLGVSMPCSADDGDLSIAETLVEMIDQPEASQRKNIDQLLSEIPPNSHYFAIASQSAAILHVQENRFSDAWRCLQPESDRNETLQLSQERQKAKR